MDPRSPDSTDRSSEQTPAKQPYAAPVLVTWGTLRDITQSVGSSGNSDGAKKGRTRTR
ncbi:hypothetical protein BH11PSE3_BH11PSE3_08140 [soil metagenome]